MMSLRRSLRWRVLLELVGVTAVFIGTGAWAIHDLYAASLLGDLDSGLKQRLRLLRLASIHPHPTAALAILESTSGATRRRPVREFLQIRRSDQATVARSASLGRSLNLPVLDGTAKLPIFATATLVDGTQVRWAGQWFTPGPNKGQPSAAPADQRIHLAAALPTQRMDETLATLRKWLWLVGAALLLCLTLLRIWLIGRAFRPLRILCGEIETIPLGGPERFTPPRSVAELEPVVVRLNQLMERVGRTLAHEREFAGNAAHELRTPLAGMRARLELALSRPRSGDGYRSALRETLAIERRLETLVENLLVLARTGGEKVSFATAPVSLPALLAQGWAEFFDEAEARQLRVSLRSPTEGAEIRTEGNLLALVLRNLFHNAVCYTPTGGRVEISAAATAAGWEIVVANTNPGLGTEETVRVFEPFWRARHEAASEGHHAGIGLTLSHRVVQELGGTIEVRLTPDDLFTVTVTLPAA